jgi:hypothetical protein
MVGCDGKLNMVCCKVYNEVDGTEKIFVPKFDSCLQKYATRRECKIAHFKLTKFDLNVLPLSGAFFHVICTSPTRNFSICFVVKLNLFPFSHKVSTSFKMTSSCFFEVTIIKKKILIFLLKNNKKEFHSLVFMLHDLI